MNKKIIIKNKGVKKNGIKIKGAQLVSFILLLSIFSFSYSPQVTFAATDLIPPVASAPTANPQTLKSGATSNSTVQMNEAGTIYLVKSGTGPTATPLTSADLTNIVISNTPSNFTFSGSTYNYNGVSVTSDVVSITVTPTGSGIITVNGSVVSSGSPSSAIALTAGVETTISVVTTETNKNPKLYLIRILRGATITVGSSYGGGKVAYVLQSGDPGYVAGQTNGFVVALSDQGTATWQSGVGVPSCYQKNIPGAAGLALGTGRQNTIDMITAGCGNAAGLVYGVNINGYTDWYLPSKDEIVKWYLNKATINAGFTENYYWTSSEYDIFNAWGFGLQNNYAQGFDKNTLYAVRAQRNFTVGVISTQATPTFSVGSGMVASGTAVTITSSGADAIYYTTDGTNPTTASTNQATTPLVVTQSMTVKALAVKSGYVGAVASVRYDLAYDWNTAINVNHTAFIGKSSAVANTSYTITVPAGVVDGVYDIVAVDAANNISATVSGWLTVDNTAPAVSMTAICSTQGNNCTTLGQSANPQESYMVKSFAGSASDDRLLSSVDLSIKDVTANAWYNGTSFSSGSEIYALASGTNTWTYNASAVPFVIDHTYLITARANDSATNTATQSITFKFTNSPPTVSSVSASEDANGVVHVLYTTADIESTQTTNYIFYGVGATLTGDISSGASSLTVSSATFLPATGTILLDDEMITYASKNGTILSGITRGALSTTPIAHTNGTALFVKANTTTGTGLSDTGSSKSMTWTATADLSGYENANEVIKVVANDGSSGSMIGSASSAAFVFDVKAPVVADGDFYIDASVGNPGTAGIKLFATDLSHMQYRLCNNANFSSDGLNTASGTCTLWSDPMASVNLSPATAWWHTATASGTQTVYIQVRDVFGNTTAQSKTAPAMPASFLFKDVSNLGATPPTYREYLDWATTNDLNFLRYEIWYASSTASSTYTLLTSISNRINSYYTHNILTDTSATYSYKVRTVGSQGDISNFTDVVSDVPNGIGGTGGDNTPPVITLIGSNPMSITVGDTFVDPGATALDETDGVRPVTAAGTVNAAAVGTYVITYTAQDASNNIATLTRTVNVVLAPTYTITATAGAHGSVSPSGATVVTSGTNQIYSITPDSGYKIATLTVDGVNLAVATEYTFTNVKAIHTISATFVLSNIPPPTVVLKGNNPMSINTGTVFTDPGITATESDGTTPITDSSKIAITIEAADGAHLSTIDMTTGSTGNSITYTVTGSDGGVATISRTVNVIDVTPPVVSDIATPIITSDSAAIVWKTNELADSQVSYGTATGTYTIDSTLNTNLVKNHLIALSNLTPETTYHYVIKTKDEKGNQTISDDQTFTTPKEKANVVFVGGGGGSGGVLQSVYDALREENEANKTKLKEQQIDAPIVSNVSISNITAFGATVNFETDKPSTAFVKYGKDTTYGDVAGDDVLKATHAIMLKGLAMGTEYHIRVSALNKFGSVGNSDDKVFKTQFLAENVDELKKIENVEQFQKEVESTIESILPSLVPPFVDKPIVSNITEDSATVVFRTNIKAYAGVNYAPDATYNKTKESPYDGEAFDTSAKTTTHTLQLTGLKSNTKYHFMAKAFSLPQVVGKSDDFTFTTAASKIRASIVDIKNDSFTVVWNTDELTSSVVDYRNVKTGINARITDDIKNISHSVRVENLIPGTLYKVSISGVNEKGNSVEGESALNVRTSTDITPPTITNLKFSSAFIAGRTDKVQTIVSWQTDEPATSAVYFEEGSGSLDKKLSNKQEDVELTKNHTIILMTLKPGTVYRFNVSSIDNANNVAASPIRTIITPKKSDSIVDIIFKNFDDTFNFIKNVR